MRKYLPLLIPVVFAFLIYPPPNNDVLSSKVTVIESAQIEDDNNYWFVLHRQSNVEDLFYGEPGNADKSLLVKKFNVKTGIPNTKPTPLPQLLDREYWLITDKFEVQDDEDIGPYFLKLDIPYTEHPPYGPEPYEECNGQCDWELPGSFGLHGVAGNSTKLSIEDEGSSGCIRHSDEDIHFLYYILDTSKEIRYYIENN